MADLVDSVLSLRQQGYSNNQIIQYLQSQGYENYQIFDAISQSEAQSRPIQEQRIQMPEYAPSAGHEDMEEIVEGVVEEKWKVFEDGVKKILEWKNESDARIMRLETDIAGLKESFGQLQNALFGKLGEYEKGIIDVSSEIKAMDRVFQKVVPTLTESVAELSRIAKGSKDKKSKE